MKDITKKVVILNNFSSPYICEAIIVLRDYNPKLEGRIIDEAERIVTDYLEKNTPAKKERQTRLTAQKIRRKKRPHLTLTVLIILAVIAAAGLFHFITS